MDLGAPRRGVRPEVTGFSVFRLGEAGARDEAASCFHDATHANRPRSRGLREYARLAFKLESRYSKRPTPDGFRKPLMRTYVPSTAHKLKALLRSLGCAPGRAPRYLGGAALAAVLASPLLAQTSARFDSGIVLSGDWLQANELPLDRNALQSGTVSLSLRRQRWSVGASWVRVARTLSTVEGGALSAGPLLHWGPVLFVPTVSVLGGRAQASRDSTGYDFVGTGGVIGHQPRYSYSSAATFGGGVALSAEVPVYRALGIRGVASQWFFSGAPLEGDRQRFLVGAGLSLRVGR